MEFDELTKRLYQENINWVYSIIKELDTAGVEKKDVFISDPYVFNNVVALGYYFMNLYVVSNTTDWSPEEKNKIIKSVITGASSYNKHKLEKIYKKEISLNRLVESYNSIVKKTKEYSPNDGLKARVVAVDEIYRKIYPTFNKRHFMVFVRVFMESFHEFDDHIRTTISKFIEA